MKNEENTFKRGLIDGLPICVGYFSVAFAFGIFAVSNGLSVWESVLISLTNVTSAGQLAGVPIIANGGTLIELAACQFIINIRYALTSIILSQKVDRKVNFFDKLVIGFMNTDEIFALANSKNYAVSKQYMFGLALTPYFGWALGTFIGAFFGNILPSILVDSLTIAIYGMFVAIVVPEIKKDHNILLCVIIGCFVSTILYYFTTINSGFAIIISALIASTIMALLKPIQGGNDNA